MNRKPTGVEGMNTNQPGITPEKYAAAWERAKAANDGTGPVAVRVWDSKGEPLWAVGDWGGSSKLCVGEDIRRAIDLRLLSLTPPDLGERIAEAERELGRAQLGLLDADTGDLWDERNAAADKLRALYAQRDAADRPTQSLCINDGVPKYFDVDQMGVESVPNPAISVAADHIADAGTVEPDPHPADAEGWRYWRSVGGPLAIHRARRNNCEYWANERWKPCDNERSNAAFLLVGSSTHHFHTPITPAEARRITGDDSIREGAE